MKMSPVRLPVVQLILGGLLLGCSSPRRTVVTQTLHTYQVGTTKFDNFRRDTQMVLQEVAPPETKQRRYLEPAVTFKMRSYKTPQASPWKIYEQNQTSSGPLIGARYHQQKFVVGDANGPVAVLAFTNGTLSEIKFVR